jgi:hypothetical protein
MEKYLIVLTGQGDTYVTLANAAAKDWIEAPRMRGLAWEEEIPAAVLDGHKTEQKTATVTCGSHDNDRALACPGKSFDTLVEALEYIRENNIKLVGEFHGCVY